MDIKNLAQIVLRVAPVLGSIIGGPVGSAAISLLASVFGVEAADIQGLIDKITNDPESEHKLKQIESLHAASIQNLIFSHLPSKAKVNFTLEWEK